MSNARDVRAEVIQIQDRIDHLIRLFTRADMVGSEVSNLMHVNGMTLPQTQLFELGTVVTRTTSDLSEHVETLLQVNVMLEAYKNKL